MTDGALRTFGALAGEALHDAVRRRIVPLIAAVSLLSLLAVDSCTSCGVASLTTHGNAVEVLDIASWTGAVIFLVLALWMGILAGLLGSDHLAEPLADGSAALVLARPVSRHSFALARLTGALLIALGAGTVLLAVTAGLLHARYAVALAPASWAATAAGVGAVTLGALAAAGSLALPRIAVALLVLMAVAGIALVNTLSLAGAELGGIFAALDRFGPPLLTAPALALSPWLEGVKLPGVADVMLRLLLWLGGSLALLLGAFSRMEIHS